MRVLLLAVMMLGVGLAGCADTPDRVAAEPTEIGPLSELSEKLYQILPVEEMWLPMDDGKGMHQAIYRPETDEPVPVFINFSPYWGDTAEIAGDAFSQYMISEYVPRGYAVVLAAIRGTGHSEGCFSIGGDRELMDLHDTVDFFANQEWSNGNIATGGKSYDSSPTNGMIAKFPHPALKGVFHVAGITDMYAYNYKNGVPYATGGAFNAYYYLQGTDEYGASLVGAGSTEGESVDSLARVIDDVACTDLPFVQASGAGSAVTGLKDSYWIERDWARYISDSEWNGSIFFVHGLQDWNVKPDHILPWLDNLPADINVKGWLHQAGHVYPERADWNQTMLRWLDSELKDIDTGFWDEPRWDARGTDGAWRASETWPAGDAFTFAGDNRAPAGNVQTGVEVDRTESWSFPPADTGQANDTGYIRMSGSPRMVITATPESPDAIVTATISVGGQWVGEAMLRAPYHDGLDMPAPVVPGIPMEFTLDAYPLDVIIAPGDELTITLGGATRNALSTPAGTYPITYQALQFTAQFSPADARDDQPTEIECFAC